MIQFGDGKWSAALNYRHLHRLLRGEEHAFENWPDPSIPSDAAGVFTVWRGPTLLLAAGARVADGGLAAAIDKVVNGGCVQLWRTVVRPALSEDQRRSADANLRVRADLSERFCRRRCNYRFVLVESDGEAEGLVAQIHAGALSMDRPMIRTAP